MTGDEPPGKASPGASFEDLFSAQASAYARYRPRYPEALYDFLTSRCAGHDIALDCATGSGQAAIAETSRFLHVLATDASLDQLTRSGHHPQILYFESVVERLPLPSGQVDLITVAEAVHWFDLERFFREASRLLRPGGLIAVWGYHMLHISPSIDSLIERFDRDWLSPFWPEPLSWLAKHYRDLPFPFDEIETPTLTMQVDWNLHALAGFISTWSGVRALTEKAGPAPLETLVREIADMWGDIEVPRRCQWPLFMRAGRKRSDDEATPNLSSSSIEPR